MSRNLLLSLVLLGIPTVLPAQRCAGKINFVLRDAGSHNRVGPAAQFPGTNAEPYNRMFTSLDGTYTVSAIEVRGGLGDTAPLLLQASNQPYMRISTGCGGDYDLIIVRHLKANDRSDTMRISFHNACDADFGADIVFKPGGFTLLVCDTTRIPLPAGASLTGYGYRSLTEQYPQSRYGGRDLTAALEQAEKERRGR